MRALTVVLLVFLFSYCGDPPKANPDWSLYSPELKGRIDAMQTCQELQEQFDISYSNSDRNRARTGVGNSELINYIDEKMVEKGCYK